MGRLISSCGKKGLTMRCIRCGSQPIRRDGQTRLRGQRWRCTTCRRRFTARSTSAFSRRCFPDGLLIALAVRWYVRYRLSYADYLVEWLAERGFVVDRSTVYRWVRRFLPLFVQAARIPIDGRSVGSGASTKRIAVSQRPMGLLLSRDRPRWSDRGRLLLQRAAQRRCGAGFLRTCDRRDGH